VNRRRDRDADAPARAGMKTGLAKQFKQVLDAQVKRAQEAERKTGEDVGPDQSLCAPALAPRTTGESTAGSAPESERVDAGAGWA